MTSKRDISTANENALLARVVRPILFARLDFSSGVKRMHTEIGPRTAVHPVFGSESYTGIGDFGGIAGDVVESVSSAPKPLKLAITGVKSSLINDALVDDYFGRDAEIMMGFDDENGVLLDDPVILWSGFMDKVDITLGHSTGQMVLTCESRSIKLQGSSDLRFTDEDLQAAFPGDLGAEYVYRMMDLVLRWGDASFRSPFGTLGLGRDGIDIGRGRQRR